MHLKIVRLVLVESIYIMKLKCNIHGTVRVIYFKSAKSNRPQCLLPTSSRLVMSGAVSGGICVRSAAMQLMVL